MELESIFHHVCLPPRLPGKEEHEIRQIERKLLDRLLVSACALRDQVDEQHGNPWEDIRRMLLSCKILNADGKLNKTSLLVEFQSLDHRCNLILHVTEQNAGLLVRRRHGDDGGDVVFEAFEASALSESVLASKTALEWNFPGKAVSIPYSVFSDAPFRESLAEFLEQASTEAIKCFAARARKAGSTPSEVRDSVHPDLITQFLMTLLESVGTRTFPPLLRKRVRDDVCWGEGGQKPWRRSSIWLVLRVGLQRHLYRLLGAEPGRAQYKFFICHVMASLMEDMTGASCAPDSVAFLKAKLNRRLAKLEVDKDRADASTRAVYDIMFDTFAPKFHSVNGRSCQWIEQTWTKFKRSVQRPVPGLPFRASPRDLILTLPNSLQHISQVMHQPNTSSTNRSAAAANLPLQYASSTTASHPSRAFSLQYHHLAELEAKLESRCNMDSGLGFDPKQGCIDLAFQIHEYLKAAMGAYADNPAQKSGMLLIVMELWTLMDRYAVKAFDILRHYNTGFPSNILDVLQLLERREMVRLQKVEAHLHRREALCQSAQMSIFDDPAKGCFAEKYFDTSSESHRLRTILNGIEGEAASTKLEKEEEWLRLSGEHEALNQQIATSTCLFMTNEDSHFGPAIHDDKRCTKCFLQRKVGRMKIKIHEHPLPSDPVMAKVVVFELACPKAFAAYRDATWAILHTLGHQQTAPGFEPRALLRTYSEFRNYMKISQSQRISLASTTKSFLVTHYAYQGFPVQFEEICRPNGLKYGYYDEDTKAWPSRQGQRPSFRHHCPLTIPTTSPLQCLKNLPEFHSDANGPTSNQIIASQTRCPQGLNTHEYLAFQTLYTGKSCRWPAILLELGASNLNFSAESIAQLVSQLAVQAGPSHESDHLRMIHLVFRDTSFCLRLLEQLQVRLRGITSNWRETYCMQMLIGLLLRVISVADDNTARERATKLLLEARASTSSWVTLLREEVIKAQDAANAHRYGRYAFWASLLCKSTFTLHTSQSDRLSAKELQCFIESSCTLQDNLVEKPLALPVFIRHSLVCDLKMTYRMRHVLQASIVANPRGFQAALRTAWPEPEGSPQRSYSDTRFLDCPNEWWVRLSVDATQGGRHQTVHYNILDGLLLIDGQALGKLPAEYRKSLIVEKLLGNASLLVYPSDMVSMTYMLANQLHGHQVHIGFRNNETVIRARYQNRILEVIPPEVFGDNRNFDLPAPLVQDCVHWLDIHAGVLEIRAAPNIWRSIQSHWSLDVYSQRAFRRQSSLVDPHSHLFQRVTRVFDRFEYPYNLTVFQPSKRHLTVELQRLDLQFTVNGAHFLESPQLQAIIDADQDAGCWYGLCSKIVLRDAKNPSQRSIIVPFGTALCRRNGIHVEVNVSNLGVYGKFTINPVLGRLDCATEPRLLYTRAYFHALTSFVIPDPLTGRTGTEEAMQCLESGLCQPWTSLTVGSHKVLLDLAAICPARLYYPSDLKVMQKVCWDDRLTTTIQSDEFWPILESIRRRSDALSMFAQQKPDLPRLEFQGSRHLSSRACMQRRMYARPAFVSGITTNEDIRYESRDQISATQEQQNVYECGATLRQWPSYMQSTTDLAGILQKWPNIKGYCLAFDKVLLSDRLHVDFAAEWGPLAVSCQKFQPEQKYRAMFLLAPMAFSSEANMDVIRTLLGFSVLAELKQVKLPQCPIYSHFRQNQVPTVSYVLQLIRPYLTPYPGDDRRMGFGLVPKQRRKLEAAEKAHVSQTEKDGEFLATFLLEQWPCLKPSLEGLKKALLLDVDKAMRTVCPEWQRLYHNLDLSKNVQQVQKLLDCRRTEKDIALPPVHPADREVLPLRSRGGEVPTLIEDLIQKAFAKDSLQHPVQFQSGLVRPPASQVAQLPSKLQPKGMRHKSNDPSHARRVVGPEGASLQELETLIDRFSGSVSSVRHQYGQDLKESLEALRLEQTTAQSVSTEPINTFTLGQDLRNAEVSREQQLQLIKDAFKTNDSRSQWLCSGGLWPEITPVSLLQMLRSSSGLTFGNCMKEAIVDYGLLTAACQRLRRMEDLHLRHKTARLLEEQANTGHENWSPLEKPVWLLLEIEADIYIRRVQVDVANATISPVTGDNSVLQMNMGQGKTSTIIPMAAALLADSKNLVRVVVPRSLLLQTAQLLQARLGGLVGRTITHIPFSRRTPTDHGTIKLYHDLHRETLRSSGIILALPEHALSFKLSGQQRLSDTCITEATPMLNIQSWLERICRDILDESDYTLAVRTQLIYPSGSQSTVDGHPYRWKIAQILLDLVRGHLHNLQNDFPQSIEVVKRSPGGFPFVHFLRKDAEDALIARLVEDVASGRSSILPTRQCSSHERHAVRHFITETKVKNSVQERVQRLFPEHPALRKVVHLLRGLFVHRILLMALKKRWNVQYGLHPDRDPVAVPFHAKGVPSSQAEWGHPEVAILFTCLSFLYGGLNLSQLRQSLEHVLKSDDPASEYDHWAQSSETLPGSLRDWDAINVDDEVQLAEVHRHFQLNNAVICYYLNHFVFPKHAKQFRVKLQASGWDIPLCAASEDVTAAKPLTTGFSGTNDIKTMLPLNIKQHDLPRLAHTNADVLSYLLQPRNRNYVVAADSAGRHTPEIGLLRIITNMGIRVLIDAGAQILEMNNSTLALTWLGMFAADAPPAAVYFDSDNKPTIIHRRGRKPMPLSASPYADNLDNCLIYLDESHTRGTDLKMPTNACGALTLGLGQTKDHTVQAAMRLRQLGTTQSVVFFAPPEVHQSILDSKLDHSRSRLDSRDVIAWLLEQTCAGIEQLQPLYYNQGTDFCRRLQAAVDHPAVLKNAQQRNGYLDVLRQSERRTLEQLYTPKPSTKTASSTAFSSPKIAKFMKELRTRRKGFQDTGNAVHGSALQEVEQEREEAHEVESVREVQKPVHFWPFKFSGLHKDVVNFVETGRLHPESSAYEYAFVALRKTALGQKFGINTQGTSARLYVSDEFMKTVRLPVGKPQDAFQRQVNYILWSHVSGLALVISPEEAELLIPMLRSAKSVRTYLLTYAAPVTRKMLHFNNLQYYSIPDLPSAWQAPSWLPLELGLFAGRLYFEFDEYQGLQNTLGLRNSAVEPADEAGHPVGLDGAGVVDGADDCHSAAIEVQRPPSSESFTAKPLAFLQEWLAVRRRGQDFAHTPMGHICQGKPLASSHPFFTRPGTGAAAMATKGTVPQTLPIFRPNADTVANGERQDSGSDWSESDEDGSDVHDEDDEVVSDGSDDGNDEDGEGASTGASGLCESNDGEGLIDLVSSDDDSLIEVV